MLAKNSALLAFLVLVCFRQRNSSPYRYWNKDETMANNTVGQPVGTNQTLEQPDLSRKVKRRAQIAILEQELEEEKKKRQTNHGSERQKDKAATNLTMNQEKESFSETAAPPAKPSKKESEALREENNTDRDRNSTETRRRFFFRSYGNEKFAVPKARILRQATETGWFDSVKVQGPEDLPPKYQQGEFKAVLNQTRGGGYWLWKIPVMEMALQDMNYGDVLVYADAGCVVDVKGKKVFDKYLKQLDDSPYEVIGFFYGQPEDKYTTEAIFRAFGVARNDTSIRKSGQIHATLIIMTKGPQLERIFARVNEVLEKDPWLITDKYNKESRELGLARFKDNRHDQSLLSVARKEVGCLLIWGATGRDGQPFATKRWKTK